MNMTKNNKMKTLAVGAAMTLVLGAGAAAVLMPSMASAAVARQGSDDTLGPSATAVWTTWPLTSTAVSRSVTSATAVWTTWSGTSAAA